MGAWGNGLLENDTALDFVLNWEDYVVQNLTHASWDGSATWKFLIRIYFRLGLNPMDSHDNCELFAACALFQKHKLRIPDDMKAVLEKAISAELAPEALDEWDDGPGRKKVLNALLKRIGGKRVKVAQDQVNAMDLDVAIMELVPFTNQIGRWADVVSPPHSDDDFERLYPRFFDSIEKLLTLGVKPGMCKTEQELTLIKHRFMIMAFYVAWKADNSAEEIRNIVKQAQATDGNFFMALDIGGAGE